MTINQPKKLLFIGDSITEWGRFEDPENLGNNYVRLIHDYLKISYPQKSLVFMNKGVGGNRITDLAKRWDEDVIQEKPDIVSISIGINDVWRQINQPEITQVYPEQFRQIYEELIIKTKKKTKATIVIMEPTVIEKNVSPEGNNMLKSYVEIAQELSIKHQTMIIHLHKTFLEYLQKGDYPVTTDGVHMNPAGNMLMAKEWLGVAIPFIESRISCSSRRVKK